MAPFIVIKIEIYDLSFCTGNDCIKRGKLEMGRYKEAGYRHQTVDSGGMGGIFVGRTRCRMSIYFLPQTGKLEPGR